MQTLPTTPEQTENIQYIFEKIAKRSGLSTSDLANLKTLCSNAPSTEETRKFIEESIANKKLNQALLSLCSELKDDTLIDHKVLNILATFSYKTRPLAAFERAFEKVVKIQPLLTKLGIKEAVKEEDKLTHKDLMVLEDMAKLKPIVQQFKKMGLITSKEIPLGALSRKINRTENFISQVHNIAERQAPHSKGGNLIFYDIHNFEAKRGYWTKLFDRVVFGKLFGTPFFHASVGYRNEKGQDIEADIWARFRQSRRTLYSRTFKTMQFNYDKIGGSEESRSKLQLLYGKNWERAIEAKFHRTLRTYFSNTEAYSHINNPASRRFFAGMGFRFNPFKNDLMKQIQFGKESVCSEFAIKSLMQCFVQLQEEVQQDWDKSKRTPKDQQAPELEHPIRSSRCLHRVTPKDMVQRLLDTEFATESKRPQIIGDIIQFHDFDLQNS